MLALQQESTKCIVETFKSGSKKRSTAFISASSFTPTLSSISSRNSTNKRQKTNDRSPSSNTIIINGKLNSSIERLAKVMTNNPYANPEHEALSGENGDDYGRDNNNNTTNDDDKKQVKSSNQKAELKSKNKETSKTIQDVESLIYDDSFLPVAYNSTTKKGTERTIEDIKSSKCFEYFGRQLKVGLDNVPTLFTQIEQVILLPWDFKKTGNICKYDAKELSTTAWRHFRLSWKDYMNLVILISPLRRDRLILEKIKQLGPPRSINSLRRTFSLGDSRSRRIFFQIYYTPRIAAKNKTRNIELPKTLQIVRRRDVNEKPRGYFQFPYVRNAPVMIPPNLNTLHALHQLQNYNNSNGFVNKHPLYMNLNNANNSSFGSSSNNINNIFHQRTLLPLQFMPPPLNPYNTLNAPMQFPQFQPHLFNSNATMSVNQAINQNDVIDLSNAPIRIVSNQPSLSHESSSQSNNNADNKRKGFTKPDSQRGKIVSRSNVAINTNNSNGITKNYTRGLEKKS